MPAADKDALVLAAASGLVMVNVFARPLHIPSPWDLVPISLSLVLFYIFFTRNKKLVREKKRGEPPAVLPLTAKRKIFWLVAGSMILGSLAMLPLLPYTVENFWTGLYYYVVPAQIILLALFLPYLWKKMGCSNGAQSPPSS
jgi:hypothetical protein